MTHAEGVEWWEERWARLSLNIQRQRLMNLDIRAHNGRGLHRVTLKAL